MTTQHLKKLEDTEIRFYFFGEEGVGKKSIITKFKVMNSSQTISEKEFFIKLFNISEINLYLKFYDIPNPVPIHFDDNINDEEEHLNKSHRLNFSKVFKELKKHMLAPTLNSSLITHHLFVFIYDLSNYQTLQKLEIYIDELNNTFDIKKNHYMMVVGNKLDKKLMPNEDEKCLLDTILGRIDNDEHLSKSINKNEIVNMENSTSLYTNRVLNYYEVSTKNFFRFEQFVENFVFDIFEKSNSIFSSSNFKERFNNIMNYKSTFSKTERKGFKDNLNPGPQEYSVNLYETQGEEYNTVFKGKNRFNKKIFIHKQGPVFSQKNLEDYSKHRKNQEKSPSFNSKLSNIMEPTNKFLSDDYYKKLYNNFSGYSFGIRKSSLNLKNERKAMLNESLNEYKKIFQSFDNITLGKKQSNSPINMEEEKVKLNKSLEFFKEKKSKVEKLKGRMEKIKKNLIMKKQEEKILNEIIKAKESSYNENEPVIHKKSLPQLKNYPFHPKIYEEKYPGPGEYEVRGNITQVGKGFTFGMKSNISNNMTGMKTTVTSVVKIPTEINTLDLRPNFTKAERFTLTKADEKEFNRTIEEKNKQFYDKLRVRLKKVNDIRKDNIEMLKMKQKVIYRENDDRSPGPGEYDIRYDFTEEKSPYYTLRGKLDRGPQKNFGDSKNFFNLEQSISMLSKSINRSLYQLPNYDVIKTSPKGIKFGLSDRFMTQKEYIPKDIKNPKMYNSWKYQDMQMENYAESDPERVFYQGKAKRFNKLITSIIPGPGQYKIPGFADTIIKKMEHHNMLKEKSLELKKINQRLDNNYSMEKLGNDRDIDENQSENQIENHQN